jgi:enterochelin esterase-like enzyme
MFRSRWFFQLAVLGCALALPADRDLHAADVKLKNKMVLQGVATPIEKLVSDKPNSKKQDPEAIVLKPITMIVTPLKRYFVSDRQIEEENKAKELSIEAFKIPQTKQKGGSRAIGAVQGYLDKPSPFTSSGRRKLTLEMASGPEEVEQGVTLITPEYIKIIALNFSWETAIATSSVPLESLDAMLRSVTRQDHADDRIKIARFYIQMGQYAAAQRELEAVRKKFPKVGVDVDAVQVLLVEAQSREILNELKLRRAAGQHSFAYAASKAFPVEHVPATVLREVREMTDEYEKALERAERIVAELGELQGQLRGDTRVKDIAPLRSEISEKLNYSTLDRLDAYTKLAADPQLKPEEKLALALSGWVVGSADAVTELDQALRLWQAQFFVVEYLRSAPDADPERKALLAKLEALEGVGPERIAQMLPLVPPILDSAATPETTLRVEVPAAKNAAAVAYWVSLPLEYHPGHSYPLIVALHSEQGSAQQEVQGFWSGADGTVGQSQRRGYVVIAPEYVAGAKNRHYDYSAESHQIVLDALRDALRRFSVDSNRVFLSGHSMGGDAAWDIGLSHPHRFAGVIPISGAIDRHAKYYLENGRTLPLYAVAGEFDRDLFARNAAPFTKMLQQNFDFIYNEYKGSGPESFYSEIHSLFEWMAVLRRPSPPDEMAIKTLRESDDRFYWLEFADLKKLKDVDWTREKQGGVKPIPISADISPGNTVHIKSPPAHFRVWLARGPKLVDFQKKLKVEINGRSRFSEFIKPDPAAMLDHARLTGDRQQIYWAVLEF